MEARNRISQFKKRSSFLNKREEFKRRKSVDRKKAREENVRIRRNLSPVQELPLTAQESRRLKLQKYKEEKDKKKLLEKQKSRPIFKVHGKIKYDYPVSDNMFSIVNQKPTGSSALKSSAAVHSNELRPTSKEAAKSQHRKKKVTLSFAPKNFVFSAPKLNTPIFVQPVMKPSQPNNRPSTRNQNLPSKLDDNCKVLRSGKKVNSTETTVKISRKHTLEGTDRVPKQMDVIYHKISPKKTKHLLSDTASKENQEMYINSDIVPDSSRCSRGSSSKKRADESKEEYSQINGFPVMINEHKCCLEDDEKELDVFHFKNAVDLHTVKLQQLNDDWKNYMEQNHDISEDGLGNIRSVIGQSQLIMDQRFKQFRGLIECCENKKGIKETTVSDLAGFWEMIFLQVKDVCEKFSKLEKLCNNNWREETPIKSKKSEKKTKKRKSLKVKGNLELRKAIQNARRKNQKNSASEDQRCDENVNNITGTIISPSFLVNEIDAKKSVPDDKNPSLEKCLQKISSEDLITFSPLQPIELQEDPSGS